MKNISRLLFSLIFAFLLLWMLMWLIGVSSHATANYSSLTQENSISVTTLYDELNTDGDCSLREAIEAANTNMSVDACASGDVLTDTITFEVSGTIVVTSQLSVMPGGPLVIDGGNVITTSGNGTTRVWWVEKGSILNLKRIVVENGFVVNEEGAGLYNNNGYLTIDQCDFVGNQFAISDSLHHFGGGIYSTGGSLNVFDSRFEGNGSVDKYSHGGGIANNNSSGEILRTIFQNNSSAGCWQGIPCSHPGGGGYYQSYGMVTIQDSTFISNTATFGGGGITNMGGALIIVNNDYISNGGYMGGGIYNGGDLTIKNSTFYQNSSDVGGGISNFDSLTITKSSFTDNNSGSGGSIFNMEYISITDSTFSGNTADDGGAIANRPRLLLDPSYSNITNCTFSGNYAANSGGGLYNIGLDLTITNSTFYGNSADGEGGSIYFYQEPYFSTLPLTLTNTIVADSVSGGDCIGLITDGGHNLSSDNTCGFDLANGSMPNTDPMLGPLQDNGGDTLTHALLENSPAIDSGDNIQCPRTDQRGMIRPMDGNGDGKAMCDIGAYEAEGSLYNILLFPFVSKFP